MSQSAIQYDSAIHVTLSLYMLLKVILKYASNILIFNKYYIPNDI